MAAAVGPHAVLPELDRVAWFDVPTAKTKVVKGQIELLQRLGSAAVAE